MHAALDKFQRNEVATIDAKRKAVLTVDGKTVVADLKGKSKSFDEFLEDADMAVIDDAYRRAARVFSPDIARTYVESLAKQVADPDDADEFEEALIGARVCVAAIGLVTEAKPYFDTEANALVGAWLHKHTHSINALSHDRQESYRQILEMTNEPHDVTLFRPEGRFEPTTIRQNGTETSLPAYKSHLLCDGAGNFPVELNNWEAKVVETEMKREGFSFWYRNPQQPGQSSLGVAYVISEEYGIVRPDFIFFVTLPDCSVAADIVDPHGLHLADALPKLQGLSLYAEKHAKSYRRIESIAEALGKLRVLDLTNEEVRKKIAVSKDAASLFSGTLARDY